MFILAFLAHNNWWFFQIICTDFVSFWELLMNTTVILLLSSTYKCIAFLLQISFWLEIRLLILLPFSTEKSIFYFQLMERNVSLCGYRMKCVACKHCAVLIIKWGLCHTLSLPVMKTLASPPLFVPISLALLSSQVFIKTFIKSDMLHAWLHAWLHPQGSISTPTFNFTSGNALF